MTKSNLNEKNIINLFKSEHSPESFNNDAATIHQMQTTCTISQDTLNDGIHFDSSFCSAEDIAHRAFCANASDMAAMGLNGSHLIQSLSLPSLTPLSWCQAYADTLLMLCNKNNIELIGGDTCRSQSLSITMTILELSQKRHTLSRKINALDQYIYLSKSTGNAHLGLKALQTKKNIDQTFLNAYLRPQHEIDLGKALLAAYPTLCCMDVTDGLYQDLEKLCTLNQVSACVDIDAIPEHPLFQSTCQTLELSIPETKITGGEDYALLMIGPKNLADIINMPLYPIGVITHHTPEPNITWQYQNKPFNTKNSGFTHFPD